MNSENLPQQLQSYAGFVDQVLKPQLLAAEAEANAIQAEIDDYQDLGNRLQSLLAKEDPSEPIETMVDLGFKTVFCNATVQESNKIFVHVGMGFHVEMTKNEASRFVKKRIQFLKTHKMDEKTKKINEIRDHMQSATIILNELQREMETNV